MSTPFYVLLGIIAGWFVLSILCCIWVIANRKREDYNNHKLT